MVPAGFVVPMATVEARVAGFEGSSKEAGMGLFLIVVAPEAEPRAHTRCRAGDASASGIRLHFKCKGRSAGYRPLQSRHWGLQAASSRTPWLQTKEVMAWLATSPDWQRPARPSCPARARTPCLHLCPNRRSPCPSQPFKDAGALLKLPPDGCPFPPITFPFLLPFGTNCAPHPTPSRK